MLFWKNLVAVFLVGGLACGFATLSHAQKADPTKKEDNGKADPKEEPVKEVEYDSTEDDHRALKEVGLKADGAILLDYFRKRTFKEADPKKVNEYIAQLGDEDFPVREEAYSKLIGLGAAAMIGLKQNENSKIAEIKQRVADLKSKIEAKAEPGVQIAAARMIARLKPKDAAEVLLKYIPFASDQRDVIDEICKAMGSVAVVNGKAEAVVVESLEDKLPLKRGAAAEGLARSKAEIPAVRKLLKDEDPGVRLRVALALVPLKEMEGLPVMVDCLALLSPEQLWPAEEILVRLAGDKTPAVSLGNNEATRKACRDGWKKWLDENQGKIDLAKVGQPTAMLGYILYVHQNFNFRPGMGRRGGGEIVELDGNKKPRWKFDVPTQPVDAQVVGPDRVLVAEYQGAKITERDFKGNVLWEKNVGGNPIGVQRLPNGNTFVVMMNRLFEIDRKGEEVFSIQRPQHDVFRGKKLRNGEVVFITNVGTFTRMEAKTQKVIKSFQVANPAVLFGSIEVLPGGGVVVPDFNASRVVEYDSEGKQVASFNVQNPNSVQRLPNGNTLVASQNTRRLAEYNRQGNEVWSTTLEPGSQLFNARKR